MRIVINSLLVLGFLLLTAAHASAAGVVRFIGPNEHFFTANHLEMDYVRSLNYVTERRVFEVDIVQSLGTIPIFRVNLNGYHVYTNNAALVNLLKSWGGTQEASLGYINSSPVTGTVPLYSYVQSSTQLRFLTTLVGEKPPGFVADPFGLVVGYVRKPPTYQVGAYYFGMWSPQAYDPTNVVYRNPGFYRNQGNDPWLGVRTIHDALDFSAINQSNPSWLANSVLYSSWYLNPDLKRKPAIGYYDNSQIATLQQHITQARTAGLSYFNFYWYWDSYLHREELADGLHSFIAANNSNQMKFMLSVCQHGYLFSLVRSQATEAATYIASHYLAKSNYLKTSAGAPVIEICDARGIMEDAQLPIPPSTLDFSQTGAIQNFISALRAASFAQTGKYPLIVARLDDGGSYATGINSLVEGGTCILSNASLDYPTAASATKTRLNAIRTSKPFMPCLTQNFDSRPRMGIITDTGLAYMSNYSLAGFSTALKQAKWWMDTQTDEISQYLTVYAWNEWHEGGVIEPSERDGNANLNEIKSVFNLIP